MTEAQAKKFLVAETKRWALVIAGKKNVNVIFKKSLGGCRGLCDCHGTVAYSLQTVLANLDNKQGLRDIAIHEVIHFKIHDHNHLFEREFEKWTGRKECKHVSTLSDERRIKTKTKRGAGKTFRGKWMCEYIRCERVPSETSPTGYAIRQTTVKTKPSTMTIAKKVFRMAAGKNYPAWLLQYVESGSCHGWKTIEYNERKEERKPA